MARELRIIIPGNPWDGRDNARHGATGRGGKARLFTAKGYRDRQDLAVLWIQRAVRAQGVQFLTGPVLIWMTFYRSVDQGVCRRLGMPETPAADVGGPRKCHEDALQLWLPGKKRRPGGGAITDDVQVMELRLRKRLGESRVEIVIRASVD